ncbi:MAG: surface lipoprotein assembly modifier [Gammaproteobacteria bacterium]
MGVRAAVFAAIFVAAQAAAGDSLAAARALIKEREFAAALQILRRLDSGSADSDARFFRGLAALALAERTTDKDAGERLLDESVAAFHSVLVRFPGFLRARAELAYAFFLRGDDELARSHFRIALAGKPPPVLAANIRRFLYKIRARKKWSGYFSVNLEQNDNINGGADADVIYLFGLPFRVDEESRPRAETGLSFSGGGEYQHPLGENLRLRLGADLARGEYQGGELDWSYAALRAGPRILFARRGEASLQAVFGRRWARKRRADEFGLRGEARRRIGERAGINARASWKQTRERRNDRPDAADAEIFLGGDWLFSPLIQGNAGLGASENRPESGGRARERRARIGFGAILPGGWTVGGEGEWTRRRFARNAPFSAERREDRGRIFRIFALHRGLLFFGFAPQISVSRELRHSNSLFHRYRRTRAGLRLVRHF